MRSAAPLPGLPNGPVRAAWWPRLAPVSPQAVWVGRLTFHHIEALIRVAPTSTPDRLASLVHQALRRDRPTGLDHLAEKLHISRSLLSSVLGALEASGWAREGPAGGWQAVEAARRQRFHFVDRSAWRRPPHFLRLTVSALAAAVPPEEWSFDPALLETCIRQSRDWKKRHQFPEEAEAVLTPRSLDGEAAWRGVVVDRAEEAVLLLALGRADEQERLVGWTLDEDGAPTPAPLLELGPEWREVWPDLSEETPADAWRPAWQAWYRSFVAPEGTEGLWRLEREGGVLRAVAPAGAGKACEWPETWLLAGDGPLRPAVRLEITDRPRP